MYLRLGPRKFLEDDPAQIAAGLRRIRRARWAAFLAFAAVPLVFLVAGLSFEGLATLLSWSIEARDRFSPWLIGPPAVAAIGVWIYTSFRVTSFRCPRCGDAFHHSAGFYNYWARRCLNCGLRLHADRKVVSDSSIPAEQGSQESNNEQHRESPTDGIAIPRMNSK
jgi:predicted RNA-binding Zn-ribbon protein involved in translation (DUF1610 family)